MTRCATYAYTLDSCEKDRFFPSRDTDACVYVYKCT